MGVSGEYALDPKPEAPAVTVGVVHYTPVFLVQAEL